MSTFTRVDQVHTRETSNSAKGRIFLPSFNTVTYGKKSIKRSCINSWNQFSATLDSDLSKPTRNGLKSKITKHFLSAYSEINKSYHEHKYFISHISLSGMQIKLCNSKGHTILPLVPICL